MEYVAHCKMFQVSQTGSKCLI